MSPMRGESTGNYAARMEGERSRREITEAWRRTHKPNSVDVPAACSCPFREWPHVVQWLPEWERQKHNDFRHFYFEAGKLAYSPVRRWTASAAPASLKADLPGIQVPAGERKRASAGASQESAA